MNEQTQPNDRGSAPCGCDGAHACGDDSDDPAPATQPEVTEDSMVDEEMTDDSMVDDSMVDEEMTDTTAAP